ncbi:DUF4290 domain-containing protein [Solitalea canadensis]|uniref:DUF4290 domain-containing protein n=1 Tax=Solitalea canadensis (strain ATCC 29591 / DSM 3403 / JCM 21819 / LMG 8368 / NBRC 15130 / NCIMB 12057 / USAM 9D) TaxID=929556 RepID=H8KTC9_SOLCM|nr:DUF4290 domain-containing protein [Solitalea canadensis]AFD06266.1 hypothetical protein Solca_1163 [Solitalea canadensis DSM 3403]
MSKDNQKPFDYNTTRPRLLMAEYGRNVQNMINYVLTLEDKEERNKYAQAVIELMGQLNPHLRDVTDFKHKLWDHLFIISDFALDVESPFPVPSKESIYAKPHPLKYPSNHIKYKHYGKTLEYMIDKARVLPDSERKSQFVNSLASFMKMSYIGWNKDTVSDETIITDLTELSKNELDVQEAAVALSKMDFRAIARQTSNRDTREAREKMSKDHRSDYKDYKRSSSSGGYSRGGDRNDRGGDRNDRGGDRNDRGHSRQQYNKRPPQR